MNTTMKAAVLVRHGDPDRAFELREIQVPVPRAGQVQVRVEAFGLNYADVMARRGTYREAPKPPAVIGYDVVGTVTAVGEGVTTPQQGQRVLALTRFGGYAEFVSTDARATLVIEDGMPAFAAAALATQASTAVYCTEVAAPLFAGDRVLVHAAAGGVGTALAQLAVHKGCTVYGTASPGKHDLLRNMQVVPIDYREEDFVKFIRKQESGKGVDVIFDSVGGRSVGRGFRLLNEGGRMVCLGAAALSSARGNLFRLLGFVAGFGLYSPIAFLQHSRTMAGVNMLIVGDHRPHVLRHCLEGALRAYGAGILRPVDGGEYRIGDLAVAHRMLEERKTSGKVIVRW
jgi:NADPH:quinone reductase-like Zn-dependent oxidoreductase